MKTDGELIGRCLELAERGISHAAPNTMVGAVLVSGGEIVAEGFHERFGDPHAEVNAIRAVRDPSLLASSTLYVNLEPCSHHGKTPPCADLIVASGIPRVVVGIPDIFEAVRGSGIRVLREAGIDVTVGVRSGDCFDVNRRFFIFHSLGRPYVVLKWAETADGFIAREDGTSKWISSEESRRLVHQWRSEESCVLVGTTTARVDDPELTVRLCEGRDPVRAVLDRNLTLPPGSKLFDGRARTLVFNGAREESTPGARYLRLPEGNVARGILARLHELKILSVIVEGGAKLLSSFIEADLWDEARVFTARETFGRGIPAPRIEGRGWESRPIGPDELRVARNHWTDEVRASVTALASDNPSP